MTDETLTKSGGQAQRRLTPQSELDLLMLTTNSVWGQSEVSEELKERLNVFVKTRNEKGDESAEVVSRWGMLSYFTRDIRLANLNPNNGEMDFCQYYLNLAGDFLQAGMPEPFLICLSRVATRLELSQSNKGFLRKQLSTVRQEHISGEMEPPKKSLFGAKKRGGV